MASARLVSADMRIRCAGERHRGMCPRLRDAIADEFSNIDEIETVIPDKGAEDFCIIGTATIEERNRAKFERALGRFRSRRDPGVRTGRARVCILEHHC